jgi:hypothetical protein
MLLKFLTSYGLLIMINYLPNSQTYIGRDFINVKIVIIYLLENCDL